MIISLLATNLQMDRQNGSVNDKLEITNMIRQDCYLQPRNFDMISMYSI